MANISKILAKIRDAIYGEEVRGSIIEGLDTVNREAEKTIEAANNVSQQAEDAINHMREEAGEVLLQANAAISIANDAAAEAFNYSEEALKWSGVASQVYENTEILAAQTVTDAEEYAQQAKTFLEGAAQAQAYAELAEMGANQYAIDALDSEMNAKGYMSAASGYASEAKTYVEEIKKNIIFGSIISGVVSDTLTKYGIINSDPVTNIFKKMPSNSITYISSNVQNNGFSVTLPSYSRTDGCLILYKLSNDDGKGYVEWRRSDQSKIYASGVNNGNLTGWFELGQHYYETTPFISTTNASAVKNGIWRGKNLGTKLTDSQLNEITTGRFFDLFLGDYWTIENKVFTIVGFDCGEVKANKHHIVVMPNYEYSVGPDLNNSMVMEDYGYGNEAALYDTLNGKNGYNSYVRNDFISIFGVEHMLVHNVSAPLGVIGTGNGDFFLDFFNVDSVLSLPTIHNVVDFGSRLIGSMSDTGVSNVGDNSYSNLLFPAFKLNPSLAIPNDKYLVTSRPDAYYLMTNNLPQFGYVYKRNTYAFSLYWSGVWSVNDILIRPYATIG